jgi:hypothetical protein
MVQAKKLFAVGLLLLIKAADRLRTIYKLVFSEAGYTWAIK